MADSISSHPLSLSLSPLFPFPYFSVSQETMRCPVPTYYDISLTQVDGLNQSKFIICNPMDCTDMWWSAMCYIFSIDILNQYLTNNKIVVMLTFSWSVSPKAVVTSFRATNDVGFMIALDFKWWIWNNAQALLIDKTSFPWIRTLTFIRYTGMLYLLFPMSLDIAHHVTTWNSHYAGTIT